MGNKSYQSADSTTITTTKATATSSNTHNKDHYLKQLKKLSHNIYKPNIKKPTFNSSQNHTFNKHILPHPQQQPPPPVYTISKNDFRDVVQKLTGSPAQDRIRTPPPPNRQPKPPSTRLQRIRPPPLAQISNRPQLPSINVASAIPSNPINTAAPFSNSPPPFSASAIPSNPINAAAPFSPLPPLPSVRVAAESPVTAYMRFLENSVPSSPVPLLSPSILFSPSSDQLVFSQLVPNPGWKGL